MYTRIKKISTLRYEFFFNNNCSLIEMYSNVRMIVTRDKWFCGGRSLGNKSFFFSSELRDRINSSSGGRGRFLYHVPNE